MATPWYPRNDEQLQAFMSVFLANLPAVMSDLGLPATFDDALIAANTSFTSALSTHQASQTQAQTDRQAKDTAKDALIAELTNVVFQLRPNSLFVDEHAISLGIPIYDTTPSAIVPGTEVPTLEIDTSAPQHHRVLFWQMTDQGARLPAPNPLGHAPAGSRTRSSRPASPRPRSRTWTFSPPTAPRPTSGTFRARRSGRTSGFEALGRPLAGNWGNGAIRRRGR